jgi:hypothetical protein
MSETVRELDTMSLPDGIAVISREQRELIHRLVPVGAEVVNSYLRRVAEILDGRVRGRGAYDLRRLADELT